MATFIMLSRLSPEGMKTLKSSPDRLQEVNREVEEFGARVVQQYALLGEYDFITVLEAPDAETVSRVSVELSSRATASYETLTAIPVEEFISRISREGARTFETQRPAAEPPRTEPSGDQPGREPTREETREEIREEIRREEASPTRMEEGPLRTGEAPPQGRERAGEREEDRRGFIDRARDALSGEEEPRRREETDRPDRR